MVLYRYCFAVGAEDGESVSESVSRYPDVKGQRSDAGNRKPEIGGRRSESEVGSGRSESEVSGVASR